MEPEKFTSHKGYGEMSFKPSTTVTVTALVTVFVFLAYFITIGILASVSTASESENENNESTEDEEYPDLVVGEVVNDDSRLPSGENQDFRTQLREGEIIYSSEGSSSCPPGVENAHIQEVRGKEAVVLELMEYDEGTMCTMDIRPFHQTISREDGEDIEIDNIIIDSSWIRDGRVEVEGLRSEENEIDEESILEIIDSENLNLHPGRMRVETNPYP